MKVILRKEIKGLGLEGDIINVKDGHARNYLFPRGLAIQSTPAAIKKVENLKKVKLAQGEKLKQEAEETAKKLKDISCTISVKITDDEKLYGSVTEPDIAEALKLEGFNIDEENILLDQAIKSLGIYQVKIKLHPEVIPEIKVWVVKK